MFSDRLEFKLTVILVSLNDAKFIAMCGQLQVSTYKVRPLRERCRVMFFDEYTLTFCELFG